MTPNEVFLSHASADRQFATDVAEVLRRHGIPVWYSRTHVVGARQWHDEIGAALDRCDWFVVILTPSAVESMWVKRELLFALQQNRFENRIVPLLYRPCDFERLSWVLPSLQIVDFQQDSSTGAATSSGSGGSVTGRSTGDGDFGARRVVEHLARPTSSGERGRGRRDACGRTHLSLGLSLGRFGPNHHPLSGGA